MVFEVCEIGPESEKLLGFLEEKISEGRNIVLLRGNLGAGKTTLVKQFVQFTGGNADQVDSPTFSLINSYKYDGREVHHFDLYRLNSAEEIEDIGFMEYIDSGSLCFIEWPEKIADFLPENLVIKIDIDVSLSECRKYSFS
ncbi:MAG: tRNA (adenosine(37)-N6)-threonylcarbamoyltransferase complex ATPase subunit type 1 TsaE [Bacteroidia bacterium]